MKRQTQLKGKAAPEAENQILPKRHQHPVEVAIPRTHHLCPLEIPSPFSSDITEFVAPVNMAEVVAPVDTAGVVAPMDTAEVVAPMDTAGVLITQLSLTLAYPFSNPSMSPTPQHPCTTPHTSLDDRRLETLFEETQEEVTH